MTAENQGSSDSVLGTTEKGEALVLSADEKSREDLTSLVNGAGLLATAMDDVERALGLASQKLFDAILVDSDTPTSGRGLDHIPPFRRASPASTVVLICRQSSYSLAVRGFRKGASDVVALEEVDYLKQRVESLRLETRRAERRDELLRSTLGLHDQFLRKLMETHRRALAAEHAVSPMSVAQGPCDILVVDDDPSTAPGLEQALGAGYKCTCATNGGEAIDYASSRNYNIILIKQGLPDLSGGMVARTLHAQGSGATILLFEHPGEAPGFLAMVEGGKSLELIPDLAQGQQLVDRIRELHQTAISRQRERRHIQSFRETNGDFLKRYVETRQQILGLLPGDTQ